MRKLFEFLKISAAVDEWLNKIGKNGVKMIVCV